MTCLAWDGNLLVSDGRITSGGRIVSDKCIKLHKVKNAHYGNTVMAAAGSLGLIGPWLEHIEQKGFSPIEIGIPGDEDGNVFMSAFTVTEEGQCFFHDTFGMFYEVTYPAASGSGKPIAQFILNNGGDALAAVKAAISYDTYCGGDILIYNWRENSFTQIPSGQALEAPERASTAPKKPKAKGRSQP
jgi:hypothetical protein